MTGIKKIGIFTSGGDAPGMNACIRAVVRTAVFSEIAVIGIRKGYQGMLDSDFWDMNARSVGNIIHLGGTILKTGRCLEFQTDEGTEKAYQNIKAAGIDALIAIGGDGTARGAERLSSRYNIPIICIPGTIDNDLHGSDFTIGFDTATNTVIEAIDKIRDTAASHNRLFFIEVMGRDSGCIALRSGIAGGAEAVLLPERETAVEELIEKLSLDARNKKTSSIVIVAEGDKSGGAYNLSKRVKEKFDFYDVKVTILGHLQRGGSPSSFDRVLASRLGFAAVKGLLAGENRQMVGLRGNSVVMTPLVESLNFTHFKLEEDLLEMVRVLSI